MLNLLMEILEKNREQIHSDPILHATFLGLSDYLKTGKKLSDLQCFKGIDLSALEDLDRDEKAA